MPRSALPRFLVFFLLFGMPAAALALTRVPANAGHARLTRIADEHAPPVVRPHGVLHPAHPRYQRPPELPLPLPPPLPEEAAQPNSPAATAAAPTAAPKPGPAKPAEAGKPVGTGLPLPRFDALRTDDVNMRAGPGFRYPIMWVYKRRGLPVEIEREFEVWRLVETPDGTKGWMHEATLTRRRTFLVQGADATLRARPADDARAVAILKVGVIGRIRSCDAGSVWCHVEVRNYSGYLKRSQFWGALPGEVIEP